MPSIDFRSTTVIEYTKIIWFLATNRDRNLAATAAAFDELLNKFAINVDQDTFSRGMQSLIVNIAVNYPSKYDQSAQEYCLRILQRRNIFLAANGDLLIWEDLSTSTCLDATSRAGYTMVVQQILASIKAICGSENSDAFRLVLEHVDGNRSSSLNAACEAGHLAIVELLLAAAMAAYPPYSPGFRRLIEQINKHQYTPLNVACREGHFAVVQVLLNAAEAVYGGKNTARFINLLKPANSKFFPLSLASASGHTKIVQLLLEAGWKVSNRNMSLFLSFIEQIDKERYSALNLASAAGHVEVVNVLLASAKRAYGGANTYGFKSFLGQSNKSQFSSLHLASAWGHIEVINILLAAGEEAFECASTREFAPDFFNFINKKNNEGLTPLAVAERIFNTCSFPSIKHRCVVIMETLIRFNQRHSPRLLWSAANTFPVTATNVEAEVGVDAEVEVSTVNLPGPH